MTTDACPDESVLQQILRGASFDAVAPELEAHVGQCPKCQTELERLATRGDLSLTSIDPPDAQTAPTLPLVKAVIHAVRINDKHTPAGGGTVRQPQLERYRVDRLLGAGGMGAVFLALDPRLKRQVAIKTLRWGGGSDHDLRERFLREAEAVAAVRSEFVVKVYDLGIDQGTPYLVMEYVSGGSLADQIRTQGPLAFHQVRQLAAEIATALAAAHLAGALHRDVKPRNVLFDDSTGHYKLTDFGLVKFFDRPSETAASAVAGTPEYMSPEQVDGRTLDARTDLFSLGVLLYEASTGESPFKGPSLLASMARVGSHAPRPLSARNRDVPQWFSDLVDQLLQKDPAKRPESADELLAMLQRGGQASSRPSRRPLLALLAAASLLIACAILYAISPPQVAEQASPASAPAVSPAAPAVFTNVRSAQGYASLRDAIQAADSGDTILIASRGPHASEPIDLGEKDLTLRAAAGDRPILVFSDSDDAPRPAIDSSGSLLIDGIEIHWSRTTPAGDRSRTQLIDTCAVLARGKLELLNSEIRVGDRSVCLGFLGSDCRLRGSRLNAPRGVGVSWRLPQSATLRIENCEVIAEYCIATLVDAVAGASYQGDFEFTKSTFRGGRFLDLRGATGAKHRFQSLLDQCRLDVEDVVVLDWSLSGPRALERPTSLETGDQIRRVLQWRETQNRYPAQVRFLSHDSPRLPIAKIAGAPDDIAAWEAFWRIEPTGSFQGEPRDGITPPIGADLAIPPSDRPHEETPDAAAADREDLLP